MQPVNVAHVELEVTFVLGTHLCHDALDNVRFIDPLLVSKVFKDQLYLKHFVHDSVDLFALVALCLGAENRQVRLELKNRCWKLLCEQVDRPKHHGIASRETPGFGKLSVIRH